MVISYYQKEDWSPGAKRMVNTPSVIIKITTCRTNTAPAPPGSDEWRCPEEVDHNGWQGALPGKAKVCLFKWIWQKTHCFLVWAWQPTRCSLFQQNRKTKILTGSEEAEQAHEGGTHTKLDSVGGTQETLSHSLCCKRRRLRHRGGRTNRSIGFDDLTMSLATNQSS